MSAGRKRIRVLYVIGTLERGGAEGHLVQLIKHLDRDRFEPLVACLSGKGSLAPQLEALGVPIQVYGLSRNVFVALRTLWRVAQHVRQVKPDIVHTYLYWANVICGLMSKAGGAPVLITSRRGLGLFKDSKPYLQWLENVVNLLTDAVTVNSKGVEEDTLVRECFVSNKIHRIYNGVEWDRFATPVSTSPTLRASLGISDDAPVVGCVANLIPYKGHEDLLRAMALVVHMEPTAHLVLVGRDDGIQMSLSSLAGTLGLSEHVHFLGSRADVTNCLHAMDVQVLPSHEEGFSNAILEGMAAGRPIVATNVGGNSEAIVDEVTGLIVPAHQPERLANAISKLLASKELREAMGAAGLERVRAEFSVEAMVARIQALYTNLALKRR